MTFKDLHRPGGPLILPNAWDHASAALLAQHFPAVASTSLGVAAALGLPDGDGRTLEPTLELARRLAHLPCYLTIDLEGGFSDDPAQVADLIATLWEIGVVGVNLEDALGSADLLARKIRACKAVAPEMFVNARTDTYWLGAQQEQTRARLDAYVDAGADGIFVPGLTEPALIEELATLAPLNLLYQTGVADLGVARLSTGSLLFRSAATAALNEALTIAGKPTVPMLNYARIQSLAMDTDMAE